MACVLVLGSGIVALWFNAVWPLAVGLPVALAYYMWAWKQASLVGLTPAEVKRGRRWGWLFLLAVVALIAAGLYFSA
jgi:hypothetical protein